jgi:hypothetical protein
MRGMWWAELLNIIAGTLSSATLPPFDPATLSPLAWYDASDTATLTVASNLVSQWNDKSGNGYNLTQGTSVERPDSGLTTRNGLNVVDFDGAASMAAATAANWTSLHTNAAGLWAIAWKPNGNNLNNFIFSTRSSAGNGGGAAELIADQRTAGTKLIVGALNASGAYAVENVKTSAYTNNTFTYDTFLNDFGNATAADRSSIFLENGTAQKGNSETATPGTAAPQVPLNLGKIAGFNIFFTGSICELIFVTGANATEPNRILLRDYLKTKWGF